MRCLNRFVAACLCSVVLGGAAAASEEEQRAACTGDALRLCILHIPDREQVARCMVNKRADLSPSCRKVVDAGLAAKRAAR